MFRTSKFTSLQRCKTNFFSLKNPVGGCSCRGTGLNQDTPNYSSQKDYTGGRKVATKISSKLNSHSDQWQGDPEGGEDEHRPPGHLVGHHQRDPVGHEQRDANKDGCLKSQLKLTLFQIGGRKIKSFLLGWDVSLEVVILLLTKKPRVHI